MSTTEDNETDDTVLLTGDGSSKVVGFRASKFQYSCIGRLVIHRLMNNRDVKILVTSKGSTTGTGKTQLAIQLARVIDLLAADIYNRRPDWTAEDNSFLDVYEYLEKYRDARNGEVLICDELEYLADRRRSMSHGNVHFSQAWQMLRYKNVITIGTAPNKEDLDSRVGRNTDIWVNVQQPGIANTYYLTMNDFSGDVMPVRMKAHGLPERIKWDPIDDDPDYKYLHQEKVDVGIPGIDEEGVYDEGDVEDMKRKQKRETVVEVLKMKERGVIDAPQWAIGDAVGFDQSTVSKIKTEEL